MYIYVNLCQMCIIKTHGQWWCIVGVTAFEFVLCRYNNGSRVRGDRLVAVLHVPRAGDGRGGRRGVAAAGTRAAARGRRQ